MKSDNNQIENGAFNFSVHLTERRIADPLCQPAESRVADRECVRTRSSSDLVPKGTNSIAVGTAHGRHRIDDQPCKGCISLGSCNPCRVGLIVVAFPGGGAPGY